MDESFRTAMLNYFRNGQVNRWDKILASLAPAMVFKKNASYFSLRYQKLTSQDPVSAAKKITVENYSGPNIFAKKIAGVLEKEAGGWLRGAYVHGSIGTQEEISYSDFDGIVIVKSDCYLSSDSLFRLALALKESERIMREMDPLQHHGWFILSEADLADYPEHYFPHELFTHAKCLFGKNTFDIHLRASGYRNEFYLAFQRLANSIMSKLDSRNFLDNWYAFKNLLSEFMLLPTMYVQAKTGQGIFKKFSFEQVEKETGDKYEVMKEVSAVRRQWNYSPPSQYISKLKALDVLSSNKAVRMHSGTLPSELKNKFNDDRIRQMQDFVSDLKMRLKQ